MRTNFWRRLTSWPGGTLALAVMLCALPGLAQTNAAAQVEPISNRYLIILETSRAMDVRGPGLLEALNSMIQNGMKGQMRGGDTLGIWTYNNKLHVGEFPLQVWTPANKQAVARNAETFLKHQKFEKKPSLNEVLPAMRDLIKESDFITVVFLSCGGEKIKGTPFDQEINTAYATWAPEQEKKKMPILTVLRAAKGVITDHAVVPIPMTWEMPPLAPELLAAWNKAKKQVEALTNKPAAPIGAPLIFKGKNPEPAKAPPAGTPAPAVSNAPPSAGVQATTPTNQSGSQAAAISDPTPKLAVSNLTPAVGLAPLETTATTAPATPQTKPDVIGTTAKSQTLKASETPATTSGTDKTPASSPPVSSAQLARAGPASSPATNGIKTPDQHAQETNGRTTLAEKAALTPQPGALVPAPTIWENGWVWAAIGIVTLSGAIVTFSMLRRPRLGSRNSLITSSLDLTDKP